MAFFIGDGSARNSLDPGKPLAYVVRRLDFTPPSEEETGKIFLELKANAKARLATATLRIAGTDIAGRTFPKCWPPRASSGKPRNCWPVTTKGPSQFPRAGIPFQDMALP